MKLLVITFFLSLLSHVISAQDTHSLIRYQTIMDFGQYTAQLKDPSITLDRRKEIESNIQFIKNIFERAYTLVFNQYESYFKIEETISLRGESAQPTETLGEYYKNFGENMYITKRDLSGRIYLVSEKLPKFDWKLCDETKTIGKYICHKAIFTEQRNAVARIQKEDGSFEQKTIKKEVTITAWYTPQIPIMNGPALYGGLPGLILEIHIDDDPYPLVIQCIEIALDPKETVRIKRPKGKEIITEEAYRAELKRLTHGR